MKKNIITIGREYGSGGYEIGVKLAERLGYQFYDRELIAEIADRTMVSESFIESAEDKPMKRNIFREVIPIFANTEADQESYIFKEQGKFIVQLAEKGNCIIVGRRADYYLKDNPAALHLFIYADLDFRMKRICEKKQCSEEEALKKIQTMDKNRRTSYEYTTGRKWGDMHNYGRLICTSAFGIDAAVDEIARLFENQE